MPEEFNHIPALKRNLLAMIDEKVRIAAFDVEAHAKANCPFDTGALRASIGTITSKGDGTYAAAVAHAQQVPRRNKKGKSVYRKVNTLPAPSVPPPGQAIVAVGVDYGASVEYGNHGRAPVLFLTSAAGLVAPRLQKEIAKAVKEAAKG